MFSTVTSGAGPPGSRGAMPVLLGLYTDRGTPVRVAHAAILAHDAMAAG